jgi:hypothetical protein
MKMKRARLKDRPIMAALKRVEVGLAVSDMCRELGISSVTLYNWRTHFGSTDSTQWRTGRRGKTWANPVCPELVKGPRRQYFHKASRTWGLILWWSPSPLQGPA